MEITEIVQILWLVSHFAGTVCLCVCLSARYRIQGEYIAQEFPLIRLNNIKRTLAC
jgi:beta-lactamase regulating signal transducer with metallopeptidase domain